jgi:hypothetical protein
VPPRRYVPSWAGIDTQKCDGLCHPSAVRDRDLDRRPLLFDRLPALTSPVSGRTLLMRCIVRPSGRLIVLLDRVEDTVCGDHRDGRGGCLHCLSPSELRRLMAKPALPV